MKFVICLIIAVLLGEILSQVWLAWFPTVPALVLSFVSGVFLGVLAAEIGTAREDV